METLIIAPDERLMFWLTLLLAQKDHEILTWPITPRGQPVELRNKAYDLLLVALPPASQEQLGELMEDYYHLVMPVANCAKMYGTHQMAIYRAGNVVIHWLNQEPKWKQVNRQKLRWKP